MDIEDRIDRLESLDEIRQLAAKYSVTLDMRDLDMHVNLFVPDVRVGKEASGSGEHRLATTMAGVGFIVLLMVGYLSANGGR